MDDIEGDGGYWLGGGGLEEWVCCVEEGLTIQQHVCSAWVDWFFFAVFLQLYELPSLLFCIVLYCFVLFCFCFVFVLFCFVLFFLFSFFIFHFSFRFFFSFLFFFIFFF